MHSALDHWHLKHLKVRECEEDQAFNLPISSDKLEINIYEVEVLEAVPTQKERLKAKVCSHTGSLEMSLLCAFLHFPISVQSGSQMAALTLSIPGKRPLWHERHSPSGDELGIKP